MTDTNETGRLWQVFLEDLAFSQNSFDAKNLFWVFHADKGWLQ
jgi:hypothetical protein